MSDQDHQIEIHDDSCESVFVFLLCFITIHTARWPFHLMTLIKTNNEKKPHPHWMEKGVWNWVDCERDDEKKFIAIVFSWTFFYANFLPMLIFGVEWKKTKSWCWWGWWLELEVERSVFIHNLIIFLQFTTRCRLYSGAIVNSANLQEQKIRICKKREARRVAMRWLA